MSCCIECSPKSRIRSTFPKRNRFDSTNSVRSCTVSRTSSLTRTRTYVEVHSRFDLIADLSFLLQSSVGREVPIWFKFVFLSELLEASMVSAALRLVREPSLIIQPIRPTFSSSSTIHISSTSRLEKSPSSSERSSLSHRFDRRISSILWLVIRMSFARREMERDWNRWSSHVVGIGGV